MDILKKQYSICFAFFVDELKRIILMTAFAAVILTLVSTLYVKNNPDVGWEWMRNFIASMSFTEVFDDAGNLSVVGLLLNNVRACMAAIGLGIIPFLFLPVIALVTNSAIIGTLFGLSMELGLPIGTMIAGILPHGIFEIPALIMAISLGIYVCKGITMRILKKREGSLREDLADAGRFLALIILPLIITAAVIEAYITPLVIEMF
ncbi:MAG: stage II sporulation protein M [Erysipelotrichaceae bacterium]|jgi:stage II sporulation protein M|nr:stage II sporulation protein M [Erysipelotrichaceae bacterium]